MVHSAKINAIDELNAVAYTLRNSDPRGALKKAEEAMELAELMAYTKGKADSLLNIGFATIHEANHEKSLSVLLDSSILYNEINDETGFANAQYALGILYLRMGVFDQAVGFLHKSLEIRKKTGDKGGLAGCYFQLTYINLHFNDVSSAFENAIASIDLRKEIGDDIGLGASYMVLGDIYLKQKNYAEARKVLEKSLALRKKAGEKMGYFASLLRWTELEIELNDPEKAREFAQEGMQMAEQEGIHYGVMRFRQILGKLELHMNKVAEAKIKFLEALKYAEEYGFKSVQYEIYESLTGIAKKQGDYKLALEYHEKFHTVKEEVINTQTSALMKANQMVGQVEFARKEAQLEKEKNTELACAYKIIEEKHLEIIDSIQYAKRIQRAQLPTEKMVDKELKRLMN